MKIIVPIGISGSGKSTLYDNYFKDYQLICTDQIRLELTGNISDQSKNSEVFGIVNERIDDCLKNGIDFYYDATNVNTKFRKVFTKMVKEKKPDAKVIYIYFTPDIDVSFDRIKNDLENNVVRSNVPKNVLEKQLNLYIETIKSSWKDEGADNAFVLDNHSAINKYADELEQILNLK